MRVISPECRHTRTNGQRGGVIVMVCFVLIFLLGFAGIALDFGRLFVVRTELQTAMDSCALAAAQELDFQPTALERARSAGLTAANLNRVNLQSANWDGKGKTNSDDILFRDAAYEQTSNPAEARYAECEHSQRGVRLWLLHAMSAFSGGATDSGPRTVLARAAATRASGQEFCAIPVAIRPKAGGVAPNYGFAIGEWVTVYDKNIGPAPGEMGWYNLDGSTSAAEAIDELNGKRPCKNPYNQVLGTPGAKVGVQDEWNVRFGIYRNYTPESHPPDYTGYAYTSVNWKNAVPQNAFKGSPATGSHPSAESYLAKRTKYASFADAGTSLKDGAQIAYGDKNRLNSFKSIATPGSAGQHAGQGTSRRIVAVPVLDADSRVIDFACMFMLAPMTGPNDDVQLEFRGNASAFSAPCGATGLAGGETGPLVSVLVR